MKIQVNGSSVDVQRKNLKIDDGYINPDNPREHKSQAENAARFATKIYPTVGFDETQPLIVVRVDDGWYPLRGNGRLGGAQILRDSDNPEQLKLYTRLFGHQGMLSCLVVQGTPDKMLLQDISSDHNGHDSRKLSIYEQFLSVQNCRRAGYGNATRERVSQLHGKSGSWSQNYLYMDKCTSDESGAWVLDVFKEHVFIAESDRTTKLKMNHWRSGGQKDTEGLFKIGERNGWSSEQFKRALNNCKEHGNTAGVHKPSRSERFPDAVNTRTLNASDYVSTILKTIVDALQSGDTHTLATLDSECAALERAVGEQDASEQITGDAETSNQLDVTA